MHLIFKKLKIVEGSEYFDLEIVLFWVLKSHFQSKERENAIFGEFVENI